MSILFFFKNLSQYCLRLSISTFYQSVFRFTPQKSRLTCFKSGSSIPFSSDDAYCPCRQHPSHISKTVAAPVTPCFLSVLNSCATTGTAAIPSTSDNRPATRQPSNCPPPKFSKTRLVIGYNKKLQSFCSPENISWLWPWVKIRK